MHKNGFTLIEVQIYLALCLVTVLIVCQLALLYAHLYDKTVLRATESVVLLAALRQVNSSFLASGHSGQATQKGGDNVSFGLRKWGV